MNMIRDVSQEGEIAPEAEEKPIQSEKSISAPVFNELAERAIFESLGIEGETEKHKYYSNMQTLFDYAKSQGGEMTPEAVKSIIRELEIELGSPPISEKRISYLARYAYLRLEESKLKQERERMKG